MKVGIIAEGRADLAVITNILKGKLNISRSDIQYLVPEFDYDETSLHEMRIGQFSNWTIVRESCINGQKISGFIDTIEDERFLVIHIDSDTRQDKGFDVIEPAKIEAISEIETLRQNIVSKLTEWLDNKHIDKIAFAVSIQEIDSWILTLYSDKETGFVSNAKEKLFKELNKPNLLSKKDKTALFSLNQQLYEQYSLLGMDFRKRKNLDKAADKNISLKLFCDDLERFDKGE